MSRSSSVPDLVPLLSRGKHRNPRRGACFMELASFLAGERWSDHPACTHPLLAEVARNVNDRTSDEGRPRLALLIPTVIGLVSDDPRADARIALRCALTALPVAPAESQRSLAVGVLACQRQLVALDDPDAPRLSARARYALESVPDATRWAVTFAGLPGLERPDGSPRRFHRYAAPGIVNIAARSIASAALATPDPVLLRMLEGAIEECRALTGARAPVDVDEQRWLQAWALTH